MIVTVFTPDPAEYEEMSLALEERTITQIEYDTWVLLPEHWVPTEVAPCDPEPEFLP